MSQNKIESRERNELRKQTSEGGSRETKVTGGEGKKVGFVRVGESGRERARSGRKRRKSDYVDLDRHLVQFSRGRHTAPGEALFSVHAVLIKF